MTWQMRKASTVDAAIHTNIVGHCGSHVKQNLEAFAALGISAAKSKELLLDLSKLAVQQLKTCQATYRRACRQAPTSGAAYQNPGAGVAASAAAAAAAAAGIG